MVLCLQWYRVALQQDSIFPEDVAGAVHMKVHYSNSDLRKLLLANWKKKLYMIYREYVKCSFENRFCETCKEKRVCDQIKNTPWIGKI